MASALVTRQVLKGREPPALCGHQVLLKILNLRAFEALRSDQKQESDLCGNGDSYCNLTDSG